MNQFAYRRPELAVELGNRLEGSGLVDARSGLFLAAPRRVGKSTFLQEDNKFEPAGVYRAFQLLGPRPEMLRELIGQIALDGLRERNLVWRESRGAYALEDQGYAEWFGHRRRAGGGA